MIVFVDSVMQGSSNDEVLQVPDENRRLGVDAIVRDNCAQFEELTPALHCIRQLRVDGHREHRPDHELRTEIYLLQSRESSKRTSIDSYD